MSTRSIWSDHASRADQCRLRWCTISYGECWIRPYGNWVWKWWESCRWGCSCGDRVSARRTLDQWCKVTPSQYHWRYGSLDVRSGWSISTDHWILWSECEYHLRYLYRWEVYGWDQSHGHRYRILWRDQCTTLRNESWRTRAEWNIRKKSDATGSQSWTIFWKQQPFSVKSDESLGWKSSIMMNKFSAREWLRCSGISQKQVAKVNHLKYRKTFRLGRFLFLYRLFLNFR